MTAGGDGPVAPDSWALVTGAASGIGEHVARRLSADGWPVVLMDRDPEGLDRVAGDLRAGGSGAVTRTVDLGDRPALRSSLASLLDEQGCPSAVVNVAGIGVAAPLAGTDPDDWDRVLLIDLTAVFEVCRALIPPMVRSGGGSIVNVSSVAGLVGVRQRAAYCAAKAGVIGLTRSIAADYAHAGIRANAICPGTVDTPWIGKILADAPDPGAARRAMEQRQLDGRLGSPAEVAGGVAFLLSADARFVNGAAMVMDGGMTAV